MTPNHKLTIYCMPGEDSRRFALPANQLLLGNHVISLIWVCHPFPRIPFFWVDQHSLLLSGSTWISHHNQANIFYRFLQYMTYDLISICFTWFWFSYEKICRDISIWLWSSLCWSWWFFMFFHISSYYSMISFPGRRRAPSMLSAPTRWCVGPAGCVRRVGDLWSSLKYGA